MALEFLPRFMLITVDEEGYLHYVNQSEVAAKTALTTLAKIEVEEAKINNFYVHLRFVHTNKYWALGADGYLVANSNQPNEDTSTPSCTLFHPIIFTKETLMFTHVQSDGIVRLISPENRVFVSDESNQGSGIFGYHDWDTFVKTKQEESLEVEESVVETKICNVRYRLEDSRIFDKVPYVAGSTVTAVNDGDEEDSIAVSITYEDERCYSFSRSLLSRASLGVSTGDGIASDVVGIESGDVLEPFMAVEGAFEWGETVVIGEPVTVRGVVRVPARSVAVVGYVGAKSTCSVPFDYTQRDDRGEGEIVETEQVDGIFTGVNCYGFGFEILEILPN